MSFQLKTDDPIRGKKILHTVHTFVLLFKMGINVFGKSKAHEMEKKASKTAIVTIIFIIN